MATSQLYRFLTAALLAVSMCTTAPFSAVTVAHAQQISDMALADDGNLTFWDTLGIQLQQAQQQQAGGSQVSNSIVGAANAPGALGGADQSGVLALSAGAAAGTHCVRECALHHLKHAGYNYTARADFFQYQAWTISPGSACSPHSGRGSGRGRGVCNVCHHEEYAACVKSASGHSL